MQFNPLTNILYTDSGKFLKKLACPFDIQWNGLAINPNNPKRRPCSKCERYIIDTATYSDQELIDLIEQEPDTCLKIDLNQNNITMILYGKFQPKYK